MNEQEKYDWMVYVSCMTYNQAPYIVDAMNGFAMQETNFPFVCAIVDDGSIDGEQDVIKNYLNEHFDLEDIKVARHEETNDYVLTFARHKTNLNCYFAVLFLKYNHYSIKKSKVPYFSRWRDNAKYIAICEGDDYWIETLKLQKQFDLMEQHPEYSFCFHTHEVLFASGKKKVCRPHIKHDSYTVEDAIIGGGGFVATNAMFWRSCYTTEKKIPKFWRISPVGDFPLILYLAIKGDIGYIDEVMSVYRKGVVGSWSLRQKKIVFRTSHFRAVNRVLTEYDKFTTYKYHKIIAKKKKTMCVTYIKDIVKILLSKIGLCKV